MENELSHKAKNNRRMVVEPYVGPEIRGTHQQKWSNEIKLRFYRSITWLSYETCRDGMRKAYKILLGSPEGRKAIGRPEGNYTIILKLILGKQDRMDLRFSHNA
jgi:hypothetical protein